MRKAPLARVALVILSLASPALADAPSGATAAAPKDGAPPRVTPKPPPRTPLWEKPAAPVDAPARRSIVDRVVGVVGRRIILLSEIQRSGAYEKRVYASLPLAERIEAEHKVDRQVLERHIARLLEEDAAPKKAITVKEPEIDAAFAEVAKTNSLDHAGLLKLVADSGMTEAEYRDELRHQLLHYKVLQTIITPRTTSSPGITSEEWMKRLETEHAVWIAELRRETYVEVRL